MGKSCQSNSGVRFIRISNFIALALCVLVIVGYVVFPFWTIKLSVSISDDFADAGKEIIRTSSMDETQKVIITGFIQTAQDAHLSASVSVSVYTTDILGVLFSGNPRHTEEIVKRLLLNAVSQSTELIKALLEVSEKTAVRIEFMSILSDAMEKSGFASDALEEICSRSGISEDWMSRMVSRITDAANDEQATTDSVISVIMEVASEAKEKLASVPEYTGLALQFEQSQPEVRDSLQNMLKDTEDETGRLPSDLLINQVLAPYLMLASQALSGDVPVEPSSSETAPASSTVSKTLSELIKNAAATWIDSLDLPEIHQLNQVLKIIAWTILGVWLVWLIVFTVILIKTFTRKPFAPVLWIPFIFGWPHYPILCLVPSILTANHFSVLRSIWTGFINQPLPLNNATFQALADSVQLTFSSGTLLSCIAAVLLFIFCFIYGSIWKKTKKAAGSIAD